MLSVCHPKILHKHCFQFLLGVKMAPWETENNAYAKFWGDKQRALWHPFLLWYFLELSNKVSDSHNGEFTYYFKPSFCRRRRPRVLESLKNCSDGELFKNTVRIKYFSSQDLAHTCKQVKTGSTWSKITGTSSLFLCLCLCLCRSLDWWKRSRHKHKHN